MKSDDVTIQMNLSAWTYSWSYLFVKILQNEIWTFGQICFIAKFVSERIKEIYGDQFGGFVCGYQGLKG